MSEITTQHDESLCCSYLGGSHAYGLNTPESDQDIRFVFFNTNLKYIIGLDKNEFFDNRNAEVDAFGFELRHFLFNLRKTNTQAIETLFLPEDQFIELHPLFKTLVLANRSQLIDPHRLIASLKGYIFSERRLANGERTGDLGSKRKTALDKYGFSPKNFVQLFRLIHAGHKFLQTEYFPINVKDDHPELAEFLLDLKTNPGKYERDDLNERVDKGEKMLDTLYTKKTTFESFFNNDLATEICLQFYTPILNKHYVKPSNQSNS